MIIRKQMTVFRDAIELIIRPTTRVRWVRLVLVLIGLIGVSYIFVYLLRLVDLSAFPLYRYASVAYISVFLAALIANITIIAPVPFAIIVIATAASKFDPWIIALCAATGGTLGELSGYYAGLLGRKVAIPESIIGYHRIEGWIDRYGFWAILVLAIQPILPFDIGGIIAGTAKMPLYKFLPALLLGKFPKYLLFAFAGMGFYYFLPPWLSLD